MARFAEEMDNELRTGDGLQPGTTQGPLINQRAVQKVGYWNIKQNSLQLIKLDQLWLLNTSILTLIKIFDIYFIDYIQFSDFFYVKPIMILKDLNVFDLVKIV